MTRLSIKCLDQIPHIALTTELIRRHYHRPLTDDETKDRLQTLQHESAHLVTAIACRSFIGSVELRPSKVSGRKPAGRVQSTERDHIYDAIVSFAGYAWEAHNGDQTRAEDDAERGINSSLSAGRDCLELCRIAEQFVAMDAEVSIRDAAVGIICLMPQSGVLAGSRLGALVKWLKPRIPTLRIE